MKRRLLAALLAGSVGLVALTGDPTSDAPVTRPVDTAASQDLTQTSNS